ncbi:MAG: NAD(+) diphosphatase [Cryobacterium sp.]|nr:NAD(+) diphosphatase [Cryobacterium sp.]MBX3090233.1 NAD(+) diphosphatase [Cryobacterium sp.]MCO5293579.1 NAD(+) diphosphatase [Homoserinimonas sp.]MCW5945134.1 NAD(+) diphosphatase [Cryobacterium sp.]
MGQESAGALSDAARRGLPLSLPLARFAVDRNHLRRNQQSLLEEFMADPLVRVLAVWKGRTLLRTTDGTGIRFFSMSELPQPEVWFYLGRGEEPGESGAEVNYLGQVLSTEAAIRLAPESEWISLREIGARLSDLDAGLLVEAVSLANWRSSHQFSPRTGRPLVAEQAGWVLRDPEDGLEVFPRIDPAIIVTVTDEEDRILLGSNAMWESNRFSLLAGFVEPGESLEAAVMREIEEESGIRVGGAEYLGSQAWPYPASLMLGFKARALSGQDLTPRPDGTEILDLRWFSREQLKADTSILLPGKASIARAMIDAWLDES